MFSYISFRRLIVLIIGVFFLQIFLNLYLNFNIIDNVKKISVLNANSHKDELELLSKKKNLNQFCEIQDRQAISALKRIKSGECKRKCKNLYCSIKKANKPWAEYLENRCSNIGGNKFNKLLGCHQLNYNFQDLFSSNKHKILFNFSGESCVHFCLQIDFEYSLQYSNNCICTNDINLFPQTNYSHLNCIKKCSHNQSQCLNNIWIYSTGIKKSPYYFPKLDVAFSLKQFQRPKIVFLLLISGRSYLQVYRLLKNIYSKHHYYYIHVDVRNNYLFQELLVLESKFDNIKLTKNRFASIWGGSSLLTTILNCINEIFTIKTWKKWDFLINLSETDFPLKKLSDLENYLGANIGKNFIKSHGKNTYDFVQTQALNKVFIECEQRMWRITDRELIKGIVWDGGSDWVILSRNFSHYVSHGKDPILKNLKIYFKYALLPAESFFHVVLRNTEFCSTIVNNNLKATNWNRKRGCKCQHKNVVDWCGCSPSTFRTKDTSRLISTQSKPLFFSRKFEHVIDSNVIDYVEQRFLMNGLPLLEESHYLESTYNAYHDDPLNDTSKLDFYNYFARGMLNKIENNCQLVHKHKSSHFVDWNNFSTNLIESSIYFRNNNFYGTLLSFKLNSSSNFHINFEMIIRKHSNDTKIISKLKKPTLKIIKVCTKFDVKEMIFRDFECLIHPNNPIQVYHEWEIFFGLYSITFVFVNSSGKVYSYYDVPLNNTKSDENSVQLLFSYPQKERPLHSGVWKLIVFNEFDLIGIHTFNILPTKFQTNYTNTEDIPIQESHLLSEKLIVIQNIIFKFLQKNHMILPMEFSITKNWQIDRICYYLKETTSKNWDLNCTEHLISHCDQVEWSSGSIRMRYDF